MPDRPERPGGRGDRLHAAVRRPDPAPGCRDATGCSGTDGFGRSDYRRKLRHFFEVDRHWVTVAALKALAEEGAVEPKVVAEAIARYGIDREKPNPMTV